MYVPPIEDVGGALEDNNEKGNDGQGDKNMDCFKAPPPDMSGLNIRGL